MLPDDLNPIVFAVSLFVGYLLWMFIKMASRPTTSNNNGHNFENKISEWWSIRKINKWKSQNKTSDHYNDEGLDNKHLKFFGCSQSGEVLFVEFKNSKTGCDAYFTLILKDELCLTIPVELQHAVTSDSVCGKDSFSSNGLTFERIQPYSKWRITYNGLSYIRTPGNEHGNNEVEPQHVTFTFFWSAASNPFSWPNNWDPKLLFRAFQGVHSENYLNDLLACEKGIDQFGSLFGQIIIGESKDTFEINLPGVRTSRYLDVKATKLVPKTWSLMAACKDGFVISLSARNIENNDKIICGCVRMPSMAVSRVEEIDLDVKAFEASDTTKEIHFNIKAAHKLFNSTIRVTPGSSRTIENAGYSITQTTFSINVNGQSGTGFVISSKKALKPSSDSELYPSNRDYLNPKNVRKSDSLTLFFNEPDAQSEQLCGGKGSSLAFLTQLANDVTNEENAFVVPQGFSLTTNAFDIQLKHSPELHNSISNVENIAYNRIKGSLENACEEVSKLFMQTPIVDEVTSKIEAAYSILAKNSGLRVAVRSSAIGEDGMESSSAGQNETILGVQGIDQVLVAIQKCWVSLFTVQSVTYRIQNIQPINTKMSVVIQSMVAPDCAGVLFTQHPVTNDPSKLLITANYGLEESVVSGTVDPDMFTVQRSYRNNNLNILERKLGSKDSFIQMTSEAFVNSSNVDEALKKQFCLTDDILLKLCQIGIHLQAKYGSPRDIEWAIHNGTIYLLQSRPMTSIKSFTAWELLHEFDTVVMSEEDYFTFGNVGEVMPEAMSPLTASVMMPAFEEGLFKHFPIIKASPFFHQAICVSHCRLVMNVIAVFLRFVKKEITIQNKIHGLAIFGHQFLTDEVLAIAIHRHGIGTKRFELWNMWIILRNGWRGKSIIEECGRFMRRSNDIFNRQNLQNSESLKEMYESITRKNETDFVYLQGIHGLSSTMSSVYQIILFSTIGEGKTEITTEYLNDITTVLSSCENAESAEIPTLLEEIATTLMKCSQQKALEFCDVQPMNGVEWLARNCITAYTLFESFIQKHGHRGFQEFDLGSVTWGMNPSLVIEMLQQTVRNWKPSETKGKQTKRPNEEIIADLKMPTKSSTKRVIKFFLPLCQDYVELRERTKSYLIAYIHRLRLAYYRLAERMQCEGLLPDTNLIFYLTHREIGSLINDRNRSDLVNKAIRRRRLLPEWKKLRFDEFQWGVIKPRNIDHKIDASDSVRVIGTPVYEGKITGRACVVKSFAEVSKIKAGDILIAHGTDIAWSPYFPILSGVVTELGGLISHGAVVAREYGLPCIIGATNATAVFQDGEEIYMDASAGVIVKVGKENGSKSSIEK